MVRALSWAGGSLLSPPPSSPPLSPSPSSPPLSPSPSSPPLLRSLLLVVVVPFCAWPGVRGPSSVSSPPLVVPVPAPAVGVAVVVAAVVVVAVLCSLWVGLVLVPAVVSWSSPSSQWWRWVLGRACRPIPVVLLCRTFVIAVLLVATLALDAILGFIAMRLPLLLVVVPVLCWLGVVVAVVVVVGRLYLKPLSVETQEIRKKNLPTAQETSTSLGPFLRHPVVRCCLRRCLFLLVPLVVRCHRNFCHVPCPRPRVVVVPLSVDAVPSSREIAEVGVGVSW